LVNGNATDEELEAASAAVDEVVSLAEIMLEADTAEVLRKSIVEVLFVTASNDAEEVAELV